VFREVRRVLRKDGTLWLNLGDSYSAAGGGAAGKELAYRGDEAAARRARPAPDGYKPKDLLGIPWLVAFALRADGWWLRQEIIWSKTAPMPESVRDRCTRSHEQVFMLTKAPRYFYDAEALAEPSVSDHDSGNGYARDERQTYRDANGPRGQREGWTREANPTRNRRSVWTLGPERFPEAHFAVMPSKLARDCVLAGSAPKACGECGAPWERVVEREIDGDRPPARQNINEPEVTKNGDGTNARGSATWGHYLTSKTTGWRSTCEHDDDSGKATVLDPFAGAGTTGVVALDEGRHFIGCELNAQYADLMRRRLGRVTAPLF
jgi:DNA modification methylase